MKKAITILLVLVMVLSLAACGSQSTTGNTPTLDKDSKKETTQELTTEPEPDPEWVKAQDFACRLLTKCGFVFVEPLSVKVKQAWYYNGAAGLEGYEDLYITYLLEVSTKAGIVKTVYYGNKRGFYDLSDETCTKARDFALYGGSVSSDDYFGQDNIYAMQNGEELDAAAIQEYYLKHYK